LTEFLSVFGLVDGLYVYPDEPDAVFLWPG
jgi:hypothetical protein